MSRTASLVTGLLGGFRRLEAATVAGAAAGGLALLLGLAAWAARLGWFAQPWWVLVAWGIALVLLGIVVVLGRLSLLRLSPSWLAGEIELLGFRRGALAGHLEPAVAGTSARRTSWQAARLSWWHAWWGHSTGGPHAPG